MVDDVAIACIRNRATVVDLGYVTPCWISNRTTQPNGYTKMFHAGKVRLTHRVAYESAVNAIPAGLVLDHLCRQRACANPDHLEAVTNRENLLRGETSIAKEVAQDHCIAGHPFSEQNTRVTAKGKRACRECDRLRSAAYRARQR